ncbi:glycosyltransferase [Bradyrhizobium sp. SZCCHNS1054]|uniref:glycosyltransferase n=1 Tax=Bradyrhizobium sp. SZCCHNS1054 TaxID=3057301 RepID=UPI0029162EC5|nr:glycosyltransferase [Bradyrhizobium sp. SZCCHNS1054]
MKVSFLIPTKDRLSLLRHCIASILDQRDDEIEIIVADNASSENYQDYIDQLEDSRVIYFRQAEPLPVTDNWQKALSLATGDYILMLGDDDVLAPDFMSNVRPLLAFDGPDLIYVAAYHYCYPNVIPSSPAGYLASVLNSDFLSSQTDPFPLDPSYARGLAESLLNFHLRFGMNAQHFVLKTTFARSFGAIGGLYQSPYPDTFAAIGVWLRASSILVIPKELVLIGIAPKSFGAYYFSGRHDEGYRFLDNERVDTAIRQTLADTLLPGDRNNTNWLIALTSAKLAFSTELKSDIGKTRYRILQILSVLSDSYLRGNRANLPDLRARLTESERLLVDALEILISSIDDVNKLQGSFFAIVNKVGQYDPARVTMIDIGPHISIWDAYSWLERHHRSKTGNATANPKQSGCGHSISQRDRKMHDRFRRLVSPLARRFPQLRRLYHLVNRSQTNTIEQQTAATRGSDTLSIVVNRNGVFTRIRPAQFDSFEFRSGDLLTVQPETEADKLLRTPEGHHHIELAPNVGLRVPPKVELIPFHGFQVPEHLISLTGAGYETLDEIGKAHIEGYIKHIGLAPDMTVVEIGSGIGRDAFQLINFIGPNGHYLGIDVQRESIAWCQQNISRRYPNFSFAHFNAFHELHNPISTKTSLDFKIPLADRSVDRVVAGSVLTHIFRDEVMHYFREIARVLKPGGLTYLTFFLYTEEAVAASRRNNLTPYNLRFEHSFGSGCYVNDLRYPTGAVAYTEEAMQDMISESGLKLARPFLRGLWSGLYADGDDGQDVAILKV